MIAHEITIDGEVYVVTEDQFGHIVQELKMTSDQLAIMEAERAAIATALSAKEKAFTDNLPSWKAVNDAIDGATTLAEMKAIVKKMARVLYWLARNQET